MAVDRLVAMSRGAHAGPPQRRAPAIAGAGLVVLILVVALIGSARRQGSEPRGRDGSATPASTSSASPQPPSPSPGSVASPSSFLVGVARFRFVDETRALPGTVAPRALPTVVWYPVPPAAPAGSDPEERRAQFPLVVFGHGFNLSPEAYAPLLRAWTRAGYVVAAPSFPLTSPGAPGGLDESDLLNQPADVSFVISRLLTLSRDPTSRISGLIDPSRIGLAGHSDGAETAMAVAYDTCCRDRRIEAAIIMAGDKLNVPRGSYFAEPGPPLLAIQGTDDVVNPPALTTQLYQEAPPPKYALWLRGGDHLSPYVGRDRFEAVVRLVTLQFLDRYLGPDPRVSIELPARIRASGLAALRFRV